MSTEYNDHCGSGHATAFFLGLWSSSSMMAKTTTTTPILNAEPELSGTGTLWVVLERLVAVIGDWVDGPGGDLLETSREAVKFAADVLHGMNLDI